MGNTRRTVTALLVATVAAGLASAAPAADRRPPNVILFLMDDMGWRDVGFMGNRFVASPNLDRLAARGVVFTQAYASAPNCAPTRACLLSGQWTPRHGVYTVVDPRQPRGSAWHKLVAADSKSDMPTEVLTIPEALAGVGHRSEFLGMWNLGRGRRGPTTPEGQGFARVVFPETVGFGKDEYLDDEGRFLSDRLADEAIAFIEENRARPFFVYFADHAVHAPLNPRPETLAAWRDRAAPAGEPRPDPALAATVADVDAALGRVLAAVERLHLADDTVVIFTSDNGGTREYVAPLRGGKGQLYEGGIRVPLVIAGPGIHGGRRVDDPVSSIDIYPTVLDLTGAAPPTGHALDGQSLVPLLAGGTLARRPLFWHFPCYVGSSPPASAIRDGDLKLVEFFEDGGRRELYDLAADPSESRDLASQRPRDAAALTDALHDWQRRTGAFIPTEPNPAYDPAAQRARGGPRGEERGRPGQRPGQGPGGGRGPGRGAEGQGGGGEGQGRRDPQRQSPPRGVPAGRDGSAGRARPAPN
ncbi:MAG: sulfatase [Planctomycetes bacterium]|nr:sulfatase [Planctomycetota bacterium]